MSQQKISDADGSAGGAERSASMAATLVAAADRSAVKCRQIGMK